MLNHSTHVLARQEYSSMGGINAVTKYRDHALQAPVIEGESVRRQPTRERSRVCERSREFPRPEHRQRHLMRPAGDWNVM